MSGNAHLAFGFFNGVIIASAANLGPIEGISAIGITTVSALLADIDEPKSKIGRRLPVLSVVIKFLIGHREFFHSLWILLIIYTLWGKYPAGMNVLKGYAGHLLQDSFTSRGISLFYPLNIRLSLLPFKSGRITDWIITSCLMMVILKVKNYL